MLCSKRVLKWLHEGYEGLGGCAGFMKLKFDCMSEAVSSRKAKLTSRKGLSGLKGFRVLDRLGFGGFRIVKGSGFTTVYLWCLRVAQEFTADGLWLKCKTDR